MFYIICSMKTGRCFSNKTHHYDNDGGRLSLDILLRHHEKIIIIKIKKNSDTIIYETLLKNLAMYESLLFL